MYAMRTALFQGNLKHTHAVKAILHPVYFFFFKLPLSYISGDDEKSEIKNTISHSGYRNNSFRRKSPPFLALPLFP